MNKKTVIYFALIMIFLGIFGLCSAQLQIKQIRADEIDEQKIVQIEVVEDKEKQVSESETIDEESTESETKEGTKMDAQLDRIVKKIEILMAAFIAFNLLWEELERGAYKR